MSNNYDVVDLTVDVYEVSDGASSATDKLDNAIETINIASELYKWTNVYNAENATTEQKQYAAVEIVNVFFNMGENNLPKEIGSSLFDINYLNDGMNIIGENVFKNALHLAYNDAEGEQAKVLEELLKDVDAAYEAYCIALEESVKQDFPKVSSEWDLFYDSYKEHNDPLKNMVEIVDDNNEKLVDKIMEKYPDIGPTVVEIYESGDENVKKWVDFWDGLGELLYETVKETNERIMNVLLQRIGGISKTVNQASNTITYDPLILDLNGDGFNIETIANGTNFDLDKNGFAEKINWTTRDGFSTKLNVKPS